MTAAAGTLLIAVPVAFNLAFALLAARFDYPDVLRRPTGEVLAAFRAGGSALVLLWWAFTATAALMVPLVVLLAGTLTGVDRSLVSLTTTVGVLAAVVQVLGLVRWPFLVPWLARSDAEAVADPVRREAIDVVFQAFNRYLGVGVGEHLGYALTGAWTTLVGLAMLGSDAMPNWLGVAALVVGPVLMLCSLEFVGRNEEHGWRFAARATPLAYVLWSLWLVATGVSLFL